MPAPKDLIHETSTTTGTGNLTVVAASGKVRISDATHGFGTGDNGANNPDLFISNRAASEWEHIRGYMSDANTLVRDVIVKNSNGDTNPVNFSAGTKDVTNDVPAGNQIFADPGGGLNAPYNLGLAVSAGSSALTIALKGADGNDPSSTNPVLIPFRNVTGTTGTPTWLRVEAASSLVLSSGSTLGVTSSTAFRIWIVGFNDGGTFRLGAINCSTSTRIYPLSESGFASSTAEGGAGAADSAGVIYTGTAVTTKAFRVLGYAEWSASGLTAGTWTTTNHLRTQLFGPGVRIPGQVNQSIFSPNSTGASGSTTVPFDTTIPQSGEGVEFMTASITPSSAANHLRVEVLAQVRTQTNLTAFIGSLFQDSGADALATSMCYSGSGTANLPLYINHEARADTASSTTFKFRCGLNTAGTVYFNSTSGGGNLFGGVSNSYIRIEEIMG